MNVGPETRDTVTKSYEFALQHVGQDKDSAEIWSEYIQFVKSGQTSSTWEEQQKMDALRKIYQRAVQIPLENVEILWKDYEAFENTLNKITVRGKLLAAGLVNDVLLVGKEVPSRSDASVHASTNKTA